MLSGHRMINPADSTLYERPKSLDSVRVNIPAHVYLRRVVYATVLTPLAECVKHIILPIQGSEELREISP